MLLSLQALPMNKNNQKPDASLPKKNSKPSNLVSDKKQSKESGSSKEQPVESSKEKSFLEKILRLKSIYAFKEGMAHVYDDKNTFIPVTVLKYKPLKISQIKTKKKDGYSAVQVALECSKKSTKALSGHLKKSKMKSAVFLKEIREDKFDDIHLGQEISVESLKKGDFVCIKGISKGHGFSGVVKRWGFGGGPASHGAEKHRTTGSIANTATQGKVFPGKKMPGRFGFEKVSIKNVEIIDVISSEGAILVKGPVPGSIRSLIELRK